MASSLANQLRSIAATSTNTLDTRALKSLHSTSLLFPRAVAATQDLHSVFSIAQEGFRELCALDERFAVFERGLFSETSKDVDRFLQTKEEVKALDRSIEAFLELVSARLLLRPAMKAVEWLVRRFRIQDQNTTALVLAFLPYHAHPSLFPALLAIIDAKDLTRELQFLRPFLKPPTAVPRHVITHALSHRRDFFDMLVTHTTGAVRSKRAGHPMLSFFAAVAVESVALMCDAARTSARTGITEEEVLQRALPLVDDMLAARKTPEFQIGGYMLATVVVSKVPVRDEVLVGLMTALADGWTADSVAPALACLALIAQARTGAQAKQLPEKVTKRLLQIDDITDRLVQMGAKYRVDNLVVGMCTGALSKLGSRYGEKELAAVVTLLEKSNITVKSRKAILSKLISVAQTLKFEKRPEDEAAVRDIMATNLLTWSEQGATSKLGKALQSVFTEKTVDIELLELALRTVIQRPAAIEASKEPLAIEAAPAEEPVDLDSLLAALPTSTTAASFLVSSPNDPLTVQLTQAFLVASRKSAQIEQLFSHPLFISSPTLPLTLLAHIWTSRTTPVLARSAALKHASKLLAAKIEYQSLIPFALVALLDSSDRVRRSALELLTALKAHFATLDAGTPKKKSKAAAVEYYGYTSLYGAGTPATEGLKWLSTSDAHKFLSVFLARGGAESVLDASYAVRALSAVIGSGSTKGDKTERLKSAQKSAILVFLAAHAVHVPSLAVQLRLLTLLNAQPARTDYLLPALESWAANPQPELAETERVPLHELEGALVAVVAEGSDMDGLKPLVDIIDQGLGGDGLVAAAVARVITIWTSLEQPIQVALVEFLLEVRLADKPRAAEASEILSTVGIPTAAFTSVLAKARDTLKACLGATGGAGVAKRARRSEGGREGELDAAVLRVTVVVELLESQGAYQHADLLRMLFIVLADIGGAGVEFSGVTYLQSLVLACVKDIIQGHKDNGSDGKFADAVRADVLVNCIRTTPSPQVQNSALLLLSQLADIAPDTVKHSVMPIFTFMGANTLRQDDEYSAHVIEQTVQRVIPPLVKNHGAAGAAELIATFVNSYKHVPTHRRLRLFASLIETLGPHEFLAALLAKLAGKYGAESEEFGAQLVAGFAADVMLASVVKFLHTIQDVLVPTPGGPRSLLFADDDSRDVAPGEMAKRLLGVLKAVLASDRLKARVAAALKADPDALRAPFTAALEATLALGESQPAHARDSAAVLDRILELLTTPELVAVIEALLLKPASPFRASALNTFKARVASAARTDADAMLALAPQIATIIASPLAADELKADALLCVQALTVKFSTPPQTLIDAVTGPGALGSPDTGLRVLSFVVLTHIATALATRVVPLLPRSVPAALTALRAPASPLESTAAWRYLQQLTTLVPSFMTSYLPSLLPLTPPQPFLDALADHSELKPLLTALTKHSPASAAAAATAARALARAPKAAVQKAAPALQPYFLHALSAADPAPAIALVLQAVLKLNDSTFRPMFLRILDWATADAATATPARATTFYTLLAALSDALGALVTDYFTPCLPHAAATLAAAEPASAAVLAALAAGFRADSSDYWTAAAHLAPVLPALAACRPSAARVTALVELAAATVGGDDCAKQINAAMLREMRSEEAERREEALRVLRGIYDRVGEEWLPLLPETLPVLAECMEDEEEGVEREAQRVVAAVEVWVGEGEVGGMLG
ncbi:armadillo-type protein [Geopyxis carbonaria]|nr:armadillo-type protein [Geopyxis carbonaria]